MPLGRIATRLERLCFGALFSPVCEIKYVLLTLSALPVQ
jgi:hypothetical protein